MNAEFMREAIRLSFTQMNRGEGGPFGAVVVCGDKIVGRGWNQVTSANDPTAHAEIMAIRQACGRLRSFRLDTCELYTSCEPCPMCLAAIYWSRMDAIFFGNTAADAAAAGFDDAFLYAELKKPVGGRRIPAERMLGEEAIENFEAWRNFASRVHY